MHIYAALKPDEQHIAGQGEGWRKNGNERSVFQMDMTKFLI